MVLLILATLLNPLNQAEAPVEANPQVSDGPALVASILDNARELINQQRFAEAEVVLRNTVERAPRNPEAAFLLGLALANQQRPVEARAQLSRAIALDPNYLAPRVELAGVAFGENQYPEAIRYIRDALELAPDDDYALNFLATVLYLEGENIEALHHWNRVSEPRVEQIEFRTGESLEPALLEQLFSFNEGEVLRKEQILDSRWKQERLELGPPFQINLTPAAGTAWDLEVSFPPRSALSFMRQFLLGNAVRAPLYQEVAFSFPGEVRSGKRLSGSLRWDSNRKRAAAAVSLPFLGTRPDVLHLGLDLREEEWRHSASGSQYVQQTEAVTAEYEYVLSGRKSISLGGRYEHQFLRFTPEASGLPYSPNLVQLSIGWRQRIGLTDGDGVQVDLTSRIEGFRAIGRTTIAASRRWMGQTRLAWLMDRPTDTALLLSFGGGLSSEGLPLNHYFVFGVGQDDPLPLRAHRTVEDGHKGHGPMGRNYGLLNVEFQRRLFNWNALSVTGLAFSDTARVWGRPFTSPTAQWYQDTGAGMRIGVFGRDLLDLRAGVDLVTSSFTVWVGVPH